MGCFKEMSIEEVRELQMQNTYVAQKSTGAAHEPAPDIWFEILPFLTAQAPASPQEILLQASPELFQDLQD